MYIKSFSKVYMMFNQYLFFVIYLFKICVVIHTATTLAALAQRSDDIRVHACFQYLV